ncbi:MAG: GNAT family N-acetyltransferase [Kaistella sp.]
MMIERLEWDSTFFNLKIGKIDVENPNTFDINSLPTLAKGYDLLYIFSDKEIDGLKIVDKKEVFVLENIKHNRRTIYIGMEPFSVEKHSYKELLNLTLQSGIYSRFKTDENFKNNEYEKLYTEWINKSITKELASEIIVKIINKKIVAFATLSKKTNHLADIGLVAVDEKYRGQGIAKDLINSTILKAQQLGFKDIQVITQNINIPARNLYHSTGFRSKKTTNIYHFWNYDTI